MAEVLDIYTENGEKKGTISKKDYYSLKTEVPWIKCVTCFVIDEKNQKILFEKRGNTGIDAGRLDLCSGHVKTGEPTCITMQRELKEELGIETTVSRLQNLGTVVVDYTKLKDETNRKNLKCFIEIYGTKIQDDNQIRIDEDEVIRHRMVKYK